MTIEDYMGDSKSAHSASKKNKRGSGIYNRRFDCVHVPKGEDLEGGTIPNTFEVHELWADKFTMYVDIKGEDITYFCADCGCIAGDPMSIVKMDKLYYRDEDWIDDYYEQAKSKIENVTTEEWFSRCEVEFEEQDIEDEDNGEDEEDELTGLDAYMAE